MPSLVHEDLGWIDFALYLRLDLAFLGLVFPSVISIGVTKSFAVLIL